MTAALDARGLVVLRGARRTIDGLDLEVPEGVVYALPGGNGAGKTTTINAFLGFVAPAQGQVLIERAFRRRATRVWYDAALPICPKMWPCIPI